MIENTDRLNGPYIITNESGGRYPFDFRLDRTEDLAVYVRIDGRAEVELTQGADYTIPPGLIGTDAGVIELSGEAATNYLGWSLYLKGVGTYRQGVDISNQANWHPEVYELALDDLTKQTID